VAGFTLREISQAGLIAAIYTVLTLALAPFSFGLYQVRVAEAFTVLPCLTRAAAPGLFVGCMLANALGGLGYQDIIFGSLLTLAAAIATRQVYRFSDLAPSRILAMLPVLLLWAGGPALLWGVNLSAGVIGLLLVALVVSFVAAWVWVKRAAGAVAMTPLALGITALLGGAVWLGPEVTDQRVLAVGVASLLAAAGLTWWLAVLWLRGENPNSLIAPLPPVLFNAFGVSLYLAPILGFNYWFAVQMIGIGQLVACYLLGLPLLRFLESRRSLFGA
jgi:uncharacterized membrane protein